MRCGESRRLMSLARDERLGAQGRTTLEAHLSTCGACRQESALYEGARTMLRAQGPAQPPVGLAARAAAAALAAADRAAQAGVTATPSGGLSGWLSDVLRFLVPGTAAAAMAAAALVVFGPQGATTSSAEADGDADPAAVVMTHRAMHDEVAEALGDEVGS